MLFHLFIYIISHFGLFFSVNCDPVDGININSTNWKRIEYDWPIIDMVDEDNQVATEFFFFTEIGEQKVWKFDDTYVEQLLLKEIQSVKLSFKYWSSGQPNKHWHIPTIAFGDVVYNFFDNYRANFVTKSLDKFWMPFETILPKEQLKNFNITLDPGNKNAISAIKDLKLEYDYATPINSLFDQEEIISIDSKLDTYAADPDLIFPDNCYLNNTYDPRCYKGFTPDNEKSSFSINTTWDSCLSFKVFTIIDSEIKVMVRAKNNRIQHEILKFHPGITLDGKAYQTESLCLNQLSLIKVGEFEVTIEIKIPETIKFENNFALQIEKETKVHNNYFQKYLSEMKKDNGDSTTLSISHKWGDEWDISRNFEAKESFINFLGTAFSEEISTAILYSNVWVDLDKNLFHKSAQIYLNVSQPEMFNSFRLKPMICDEFYHCFDMFITKLTEDGKTQIINFNFNRDIEANNIKLIFVVEYFKPAYKFDQTNFTVNFSFKLRNFGNPCFESLKCGQNGICSSNVSSSATTCLCNKDFSGPLCDRPDYCRKQHYINEQEKNTSGQKYCDKLPPDIPRDCINVENTFRCTCDGTEINWNNKTKTCDKLKMDVNNKWILNVKTTPIDEFSKYPGDTNNGFEINFYEIETGKNPCLTVDYKSQKSAILEVRYNSIDPAFSYFLTKGTKSIEVCMNHFRIFYEKNFKLQFKISKIEGGKFNNEDNFSLISIKPHMTKAKEPVSIVKKWTDKNKDEIMQFEVLPTDSLKPDYTTFGFNKQVTNLQKDEFEMNVIMSPWISANENFTNKDLSYFKITFADLAKAANVKAIILYHTNKKTINSKTVTNTKDADDKKTRTYKIDNIPKQMFGYFKLVIEITITPDTQSTLNLNSLSIGDPCFNSLDEKSICEPSNQNNYNESCIPTSPSDKGCKCKPGFTGPDCKWKDLCAEKICDRFVYKIPFDNVCKQINEKDYKCLCPEKYFSWNEQSKLCVRTKQYVIQTDDCKVDPDNCPFFKGFISSASWASDKLPQIGRTFDKKKLIPFYYTTEQINKISFEKIDKTQNDLCMNVNYRSTGRSNISVFYENNQPFQLPKISDELSSQTICVSDLTDQDHLSLKINFKQIQDKKQDITLIKITKSTFNLNKIDKNVSSYLSYMGVLNQQWPFYTPSEGWKPDDSNNKITFKAQSGHREHYIFSQWLQQNKKEMLFRSLYTPINDTADFKIDFLIYNNKFEGKVINTTQNSLLVIANKTNDILRTRIPPQETNFKFAIRITYDNHFVENTPLFKLEKIDIGDPCVSDGFILNLCHDRGTCERNLTLTKGYKCNCNASTNTMKWDGDDCETGNYCDSKVFNDGKSTGRDFCKDPNTCSNIPGEFKFKCTCPQENSIWNFTSHGCDPIPKCLGFDCKDEKKICIESDKPHCECKDDYVMLDNKTQTCELFDPCNKEHRKAAGVDKPLCSDKYSKCQTIKYGAGSENDWECLCNFGFEKENKQHDTNCKPVVCNYPFMNHCQQKCQIKDNITDTKSDIYECSCYPSYNVDNKYGCKLNSTFKCKDSCDSIGQYCDTDGTCNCKEGYDKKDGKCELKSTDDNFLKLCPSGKLTNKTNEKQHCDCGPDYEFNEKTLKCDLKPICGLKGAGRKNCTSQGKICELIGGKENKYECKCLEEYGQEDQGDKCVDFCSVIVSDIDTRSDRCKEKNARCNPNLIRMPIKDRKSFKTQIDNEEFCECAPGFTKDNAKNCVVNKISSRFTLQFKDDSILKTNCSIQPEFRSNITNDLVNNHDQDYIKDKISSDELNYNIRQKHLSQLRMGCLSRKIEEFIKSYIENYKELRVDTCEKPDKSEYITCTFVLILENESQNNTKMFEKLKTLCNPYDKQNCFVEDIGTHFYSMPDPPTDSSNYFILDDKSLRSVALTPVKGCGETTDKFNPCPLHSNCIQDEKSTYYSCKCDPEFYTPILPPIDLPNADNFHGKYLIEKCLEKDKCPAICNEKGNTCVQKSNQRGNGNWYIQYACNCKGKVTNEMPFRNNITACTEACDKIQCHKDNGVQQMVGASCQCVCKEGYYGSGCESEHTVSKGGWIAGIVVLAVLVVILAGVAFMFARRSRNNSTEYSGRPMDDYTGSSYRVPPNQSRGQQNPSFTRE